jgi:hypothetical protein
MVIAKVDYLYISRSFTILARCSDVTYIGDPWGGAIVATARSLPAAIRTAENLVSVMPSKYPLGVRVSSEAVENQRSFDIRTAQRV